MPEITICNKCGTGYCPDLPEDRREHQRRHKEMPHHEWGGQNVTVESWQLNFPMLIHNPGCGGEMEVKKIWVDSMEDTDAGKGKPHTSARIVLGLMCTGCGYMNALKFSLHPNAPTTVVHNWTTGKPWVKGV